MFQSFSFFQSFPNEIKSHICTTMDIRTLLNFAQTSSENLKLALPELIKRQEKLFLPPNINFTITGEQTYIYTQDSLFVCGNNWDGQLGLGGYAMHVTLEKNERVEGNITRVIADTGGALVLTGGALVLTDDEDNFYNFGGHTLNWFNNLLNSNDEEPTIVLENVPGKILRAISDALHTFVHTDQGLYARGENRYGELGLGDNESRNQFTKIEGIEGKIQQVIAANYCTFILTDQALYSCGKNNFGQLGLGSGGFKESVNVFQKVETLPDELNDLFHFQSQINFLKDFSAHIEAKNISSPAQEKEQHRLFLM